MSRNIASLTAFVCLIVLSSASTSCVNDLADLKEELSKGNFVLWYPAEAGITTGQIWRMRDGQKDILFLRPGGLQVTGPNPARFKALEKKVSADISLEASFGSQVFGNAGPLAAELKTATVRSVSLDFGRTEIERLPLGQLQSAQVLAGLPPEYHNALDRVTNGQDDHVLISAVVTTSGMSYVFECENAETLKASAPKITELIGAAFEIKIVSKTKAVWEIPDSERMTIGVSFVSGELLNMSEEAIAAALRPLLMDKKMGPSQFLRKLREVPRGAKKKIDT